MTSGRGKELMVLNKGEFNISQWVPFFVVSGVVAGFIALAWYAYHSGMQSMREEDLMVVEADKSPLKEKPVDPGGMQFPNQDKTIFDTFAGKIQQPQKVERILPVPEEPIPKNADMSETSSWINKEAKPAVPAPTEQMFGKEEKVAQEDASIHPVVPAKLETPDDQSETYVAPKSPSPSPLAGESRGEGNVSTGIASNTVIIPLPNPPPQGVRELKPKPSASVFDHAGAFKVQLGAYRSDKEARENWEKMLKKHAVLTGKEPQIVKADLGAKGVYYRLRVDGLASENEAKMLCSSLVAKGQACILPVKE